MRSFELRAQAARIRAHLPNLREQRDEAEERLRELEMLLTDEKAAVKDLSDEADRLDGREPSVPEDAKRCSDCGRRRGRAEFHRNASASDGLQSRCKGCYRERRRLEKAA